MIKTWIAAVMAVICSFLGIYDYGEEQITEGYALMEEKDYAGACEQFESALEQVKEEVLEHPDEEIEQYVITEAYRGLGMSAYEMQEYELCIEYLQKAMDEGTEPTPVIYNLMGISKMKLKDYEAALSVFELGVALQEGTEEFEKVFREMRFNRIACYENLLDWENARLEAEAYLKIYPDDDTVQKEYLFLKTR